jgi:hypothetical protein
MGENAMRLQWIIALVSTVIGVQTASFAQDKSTDADSVIHDYLERTRCTVQYSRQDCLWLSRRLDRGALIDPGGLVASYKCRDPIVGRIAFDKLRNAISHMEWKVAYAEATSTIAVIVTLPKPLAENMEYFYRVRLDVFDGSPFPGAWLPGHPRCELYVAINKLLLPLVDNRRDGSSIRVADDDELVTSFGEIAEAANNDEKNKPERAPKSFGRFLKWLQ